MCKNMEQKENASNLRDGNTSIVFQIFQRMGLRSPNYLRASWLTRHLCVEVIDQCTVRGTSMSTIHIGAKVKHIA